MLKETSGSSVDKTFLDKKGLGNYKPKTIIFLDKQVATKHCQVYLNDTFGLDPFHLCFQLGCKIRTALVAVFDNTSLQWDSGSALVLILFDISVALDTAEFSFVEALGKGGGIFGHFFPRGFGH